MINSFFLATLATSVLIAGAPTYDKDVNGGGGVPNQSPFEQFDFDRRHLTPVILQNNSSATHDCDTVLVGDESDVCSVDNGCVLKTKRKIRHSMWGKSVYFCDGERVSVSSLADNVIRDRLDLRTPLTNTDSISYVYQYSGPVLRNVFSHRSQQGMFSPTKYSVSELLVMSSWHHLVFRNYTDGSFGLLSSDCFRDLSLDVDESDLGSISGDSYVYTSHKGGHPEFCNKRVALKNYEDFCGDSDFAERPCVLKFAPLHVRYDDETGYDNRPWEEALENCYHGFSFDVRAVSYRLGVKVPIGFDFNKAGRGGLIPCRLELDHGAQRKIKVVYAQHSWLVTVTAPLISALNSLMLDVVEPVTLKFFDVCWKAISAIVSVPAHALGNVIFGNTYVFLFLIITVVTFLVIGYKMIRKLTSSVVYTCNIPYGDRKNQ